MTTQLSGREENLYMPDCIRTVSGIYINVFDPKPEMICIEDIAHGLSMQVRFGGHLPVFYSVAEHSLNCSYLIENPARKLEALMHDASEAYLMDIPRPIKNRLSNYKEIENNLMIVIAEKFGFDWPLSPEVKQVDEQMLQLEWDGLMIGDSFFRARHTNAKADFLSLFKYYSQLTQPTPRLLNL